jgi:hypothetical protein
VSDIFPPVQQKCTELEDVHLETIDNIGLIKCKCAVEWSMVDGKLDAILKGDGGAYCSLCDITREAANYLDYITEKGMDYMLISKTAEIRQERWDKLQSNEIEYSDVERHGQCHEPLLTSNGHFRGILHQKLRSLDWLQKLLYHLESGQRIWSETEVFVKNRLDESKKKVR